MHYCGLKQCSLQYNRTKMSMGGRYASFQYWSEFAGRKWAMSWSDKVDKPMKVSNMLLSLHQRDGNITYDSARSVMRRRCHFGSGGK